MRDVTTLTGMLFGKQPPLGLMVGNVLAGFTDMGPTGACGQSMSTTCPHCVLHVFDNEDEFRGFLAENPNYRNGVQSQMHYAIVGSHGSGAMHVTDHRYQEKQ